MTRRYAPIAAGALAGIIVVAGVIGIGRMTAGGQDTTGYEKVRWLNVEVAAPSPDSSLAVRRDVPFSDEHPRYLIRISQVDVQPPKPGDEEAWIAAHREITIDAETGQVISDALARLNSEAAALLDTVRVVSEPPHVWPYSDGERPAGVPERWGNLSYIQPPSAAGIVISVEFNDCDGPCPSKTITLSNGWSQLSVDAASGEVVSWEGVRAEDRPAFERFVGSTTLVAATPVAAE